MEKVGQLLIVQIDHMTGEEIGLAMESLSIPGVNNRSVISALTKKGRMGYLLLLDVEPAAEGKVRRLLVEVFGTYGYHRVSTRHIHEETSTRKLSLIVRRGERSLEEAVRLKQIGSPGSGPCFLESDDLFALLGRIQKELSASVPLRELRRRIEALADNHGEGPFELFL